MISCLTPMKRYIYDTQTGAITPQTPSYNPAVSTAIDPETGNPVITPNPRYIVCREVVEPRPTHDPATQRLRSTTTTDEGLALILRGWEIVDRPPAPPAPRWQEFASAVLDDVAIGAMIDAAPRRLFGILTVGLGQAAQGDPSTFATGWGKATAAGLATPELAAHLEALGQQFDLPAVFLDLVAGRSRSVA